LDAETLAALRAEIPGLDRSVYLNTGTLGPSPRRVTELFLSLYREWQEAGPGNPEVYLREARAAAAAKETLAAFLGVEARDLALTSNSTDGINIVARGIDWDAGDEVVISDQEHPAGLLIWLHLRQTKGVRVRIARLSWESGPRNVEEVAARITPRTRLVALSHVSCMTGLLLPAREIVEAAHSRGVPVLFDGAQAVGQFPLDLRQIGCDFYAMNGHKWLLGPVGTGALYVSPEALVELVPDRVGDGSAEAWEYSEEGSLRLRQDGRRFEFGTRCYPLHAAWPAAVDFISRVGLETVRRRSLALARRLREGLAGVEGVTVLGPTRPADEDLMTGIVSCRLEGLSGEEAYRALLERFGVVTRPVPELRAVRFSAAFFNTEEETDAAVEAVAALVRETRD